MLLEHPATRSGWRDHVIIAAERVQNASGQVPRRRPITGVIRGLAATGLVPRDLHLAASLLKQANSGKRDARAVKIDQACHEQANARLACRARPTLSRADSCLDRGHKMS